MSTIISKLKPGVSVRTHLLTAALLWTAVGLMLMIRGALWFDKTFWWLAIIAIAVGTGKSFGMLDRAAKKNIGRILGLADGTCIGGVYSWKMWGMVGLMVILGRLLRTSSLPRVVIGFVYVAIGWGLCFSSRLIWRVWRR